MQLSYRNITAPAGQIAHKSVEFGQRVQPVTPLMAIVSNDWWIIANFKETQLTNMKSGQILESKLDIFRVVILQVELIVFPLLLALIFRYCLPIMLRKTSPKLCSGFR